MKQLILYLLPFLLLTSSTHPMFRTLLGSKTRSITRLLPAAQARGVGNAFRSMAHSTPIKEDDNTVVFDLRKEENAAHKKSAESKPDFQVAVGETFVIEKTEDLSKGEEYFIDIDHVQAKIFLNC